MKTCPRCHTSNQYNSRFCSNCAYPLENINLQLPKPQKDWRSELTWRNGVILLSIFIGCVVLMTVSSVVETNKKKLENLKSVEIQTQYQSNQDETKKTLTSADALVRLRELEVIGVSSEHLQSEFNQIKGQIPKNAPEFKEAQIITERIEKNKSKLGTSSRSSQIQPPPSFSVTSAQRRAMAEQLQDQFSSFDAVDIRTLGGDDTDISFGFDKMDKALVDRIINEPNIIGKLKEYQFKRVVFHDGYDVWTYDVQTKERKHTRVN